MNKTHLIAGIAGVLTAVSAMGQGAFNFNNLSTEGRPKIFDKDGVTPIAGANFLVDVLVKNPTSGNYEGVLRNGVAFTGVAPLTGGNAGLFSGSVLTVPFIAGGQNADIRIRAWDVTSGATYAEALYKNEIDLTIGLGAGGTPPGPPSSITNFRSFALVPEPSTYALAALGLGGLLLFRRK